MEDKREQRGAEAPHSSEPQKAILNSIKVKLGKEPLMGNIIEGFGEIKQDYINLLPLIEDI